MKLFALQCFLSALKLLWTSKNKQKFLLDILIKLNFYIKFYIKIQLLLMLTKVNLSFMVNLFMNQTCKSTLWLQLALWTFLLISDCSIFWTDVSKKCRHLGDRDAFARQFLHRKYFFPFASHGKDHSSSLPSNLSSGKNENNYNLKFSWVNR